MIDLFFSLDIILTFFKQRDDSANLKENAFKYMSSFFIFDCAAVLPSLITGQDYSVYFMKMVRFVHFNRLF